MPNLDSVPGSVPANGSVAARDLFALTDEQILEIQPDAQDVEVRQAPADSASESQGAAATTAQDAAVNTAPTGPFASPEEMRGLAELYPGGLSQAKTAAERARTLDEIDVAYFGTTGNSPEQVSTARAQLAQRMLHENPAAFREMVFAGLRALEETNAAAVGDGANQPAAAPPSSVMAQHAASLQGNTASASHSHDPNAPYVAFERAANEELERSVGASIERTIAQALPNLGKGEGEVSAGARNGSVSLRERLASSVRQDVEAALKGDRQLGEQIAQILAAKRFDDATRAQVVRLIGDRAQQLVPSAARRVIGEWTSTTLSAHGARSERTAAASGRREVASAATRSSPQGRSERGSASGRAASSRNLDYRKLSDEQIVDL